MERYKIYQAHAGQGDSPSGVTLQQIDGTARPVGGIWLSGPLRGMFASGCVSQPGGWQLALASYPTDEESADEAERLLTLGDELLRKLRRRIEDTLRKGDPNLLIRVAERISPNLGLFP